MILLYEDNKHEYLYDNKNSVLARNIERKKTRRDSDIKTPNFLQIYNKMSDNPKSKSKTLEIKHISVKTYRRFLKLEERETVGKVNE